MADRYRIVVIPAADAKMATWDIPADVRRWADDQLRDVLAVEPASHLRPGIAPWGERLNIFSPRLAAHGDPPADYVFMFHVVYAEDENTLTVLDCGYSKITRPTGP
jgi:hypothetical protein